MSEVNPTTESVVEIGLDELASIASGADYSYAYSIIGEIRVFLKSLIASGLSPEEARRQVRAKYWNKVLDICKRHPDSCGPEKQAQVIFMFIIGS